MTNAFHAHIRKSLADENLQVALDNNTGRRLKDYREAFASLADPEALRQRARAVRADVIANLDRYLDQFIAQVQANGIIVHRAADAHEAVEIVLHIARSHNARLVAKSKSMVSEEIHLNPALEAAGIRVVETDLGEYIVQLRGEPPSHILTPAVHLRRQQVGELFHEKLGVPYTEEIPVMTDTARRTLRQVFLDADIGLSGVNFGVAESGTLAILTNEGNGRMVTTLPKVHIALMGMERLVPTFDDLALMLTLLPRSASGQKITAYASLIHAPRRPDDADGPRERHLIILDNGRSAIHQSPLAEALYCIRCGACLNACPVFRELGGHAYVDIHGTHAPYPGPIGSVLSPALFGVEEFGQLARASSLCGACKEICPVDIDLPRLLLRVRAGLMAPAGKTTPEGPAKSVAVPGYLRWGLRAFGLIASHPWMFGLLQRLAGIASRVAAPFSPWIRLPAFTGWGYSRDFPRPAVKPFRARWKAGKLGVGRMVNSSPRSPNLPPANEPIPQSAALPVCQPADLPTRFAVELTAMGGKVTFCRASELAGQVLALLGELNVSAIQVWDGIHLPAGLLNALQLGGIRVSQKADASIRVGLTGVFAAVAETGTVVLPGGAGRPLTASLLPEAHIAVMCASAVHQNLAQVLHLSEVRAASAVALVSGPSRTSDIEMSLTIGVHGPGKVHVFCVQDQ